MKLITVGCFDQNLFCYFFVKNECHITNMCLLLGNILQEMVYYYVVVVLSE